MENGNPQVAASLLPELTPEVPMCLCLAQPSQTRVRESKSAWDMATQELCSPAKVGG